MKACAIRLDRITFLAIQLLVRRLDTLSDNVVALTGPLPDLDQWAAALPPNLAKGVKEFKLLEDLGS